MEIWEPTEEGQRLFRKVMERELKSEGKRRLLSLHGLPHDIIGEPFTCDTEQGIIRYVDCYVSSWTRPNGQVDKWWYAIPMVDLDKRDEYGDRNHEYRAIRKMIILNRLFHPIVPEGAEFVGVIDDELELPRYGHIYHADRFYLFDMGYTEERIDRE